jgi:hypothetical protein
LRDDCDHRRRRSARANHVFASIHPTNPFVSPTAHPRNAFSGIADNYLLTHIHGFATKITKINKIFLGKNITKPTLLIYPH